MFINARLCPSCYIDAMKVSLFSLVAVILVLIAAPQTIAAEKIWPARGVVQAPLDDNGGVVIAHEDMPGLMPAMTMRFTVANPAEAQSLKVGDKVSFRLHVGETSWTVSDFMVEGHVAVATATPSATPVSSRLREGDLVPEFSLITEQNRPLTLADLRGRLTVVTFIFTRCPVPEYCPAMAAHFEQLQAAILADAKLAPRVRLLSITLDPEFDRPDILRAYGEAVGADPAVWQFATGSVQAVSGLTKAFAVYTERNGVTLDHTLCTALINSDGRVVEIWRGNGWKTEEVLGALRQTQ